jgi:hypothetical protein
MIMHMRRHVIAAFVGSWLAACGPVAYVSQVTLKADDAVEAARAVEADKYSPYWWTRATQYLHMAREVAAHADYPGANHFGRLSAEAAEKATAEAEAAPRVTTPPPDHRDVAPAKDIPAKATKDTVAPAKDPAAVAPAKESK